MQNQFVIVTNGDGKVETSAYRSNFKRYANICCKVDSVYV